MAFTVASGGCAPFIYPACEHSRLKKLFGFLARGRIFYLLSKLMTSNVTACKVIWYSNHLCDLGRVYECEYGVFPHSKFVRYLDNLRFWCGSSPARYKLLKMLGFLPLLGIGFEPLAEHGLDLKFRRRLFSAAYSIVHIRGPHATNRGAEYLKPSSIVMLVIVYGQLRYRNQCPDQGDKGQELKRGTICVPLGKLVEFACQKCLIVRRIPENSAYSAQLSLYKESASRFRRTRRATAGLPLAAHARGKQSGPRPQQA